MKLKKYLLGITVFVCGAVVMIFELTGSRIIAPYVGTSIMVWTSLIGVILTSLSAGYWLGGKIADRSPEIKNLSAIILLSAVFIAATSALKDIFLNTLCGISSNAPFNALLPSIVLFAPASMLLGMVVPFSVKLRLTDLNESGKTAGNLYALSTIGSIAGTFLAGFVLIPMMGSSRILYALTAILIPISLLLSGNIKTWLKKNTFLLAVTIISLLIALFVFSRQDRIIDIDTPYNRVLIYNTKDIKTGKEIKVMQLNNYVNSGMFLYDDTLVYDYFKAYKLLTDHFYPSPERALMIGGGAYSFPIAFLKNYKNSDLDVVEIDPVLTKLAKENFRLTDNSRMKIYHQDGRVFLNNSDRKYDIIYWDVFKSDNCVPYQLTTTEVMEKVYHLLNDDGVLIMNILSSIEGRRGRFLRAEYTTIKTVFDHVLLFPIQNQNPLVVQNIMLVGIKSDIAPSLQSQTPEIQHLLGLCWVHPVTNDIPVLTDEFAPADLMVNVY